jgi:dienelactone hydrolase
MRGRAGRVRPTINRLEVIEGPRMRERSRVSFRSGKVDLRGYLYLPDAADDRQVPCVVLCHCFSGTTDRLTMHADWFAAAGLAALLLPELRGERR